MVTKAAKKAIAPHPLADLIPPASLVDEYKNRFIKNIKDFDLLEYAKDAKKNTLLFGDTGPGKTMMVMAFCAHMQIPVVTMSCNGGIDPNSIWGGYVYDPATGGLTWMDSDITSVIEHGGCLYVDEPNFMPPKTAAVFHPLLDRRRFITIMDQGNRRVAAHDDLFVIGSYNPDYEGTRPLNKALKNRFKLKLHIDYDDNVESQLVFMPVVLSIAKQLRAARSDSTISTPTSTNMLIELEEFAVDLGLDFAIENFLAAFEGEEIEAVRNVFEMNMALLTDQLAQLEALTD